MPALPSTPASPPYTWDVPFLGIRTRFESNAEHVVALAQDALGAWGAAGDVEAPEEPVVVRIDVDEGDPAGDTAARVPFRYDIDGRRLRITGPGVEAAADLATRRARARVAAHVVADREHFRYGVLESLALFILSYLDRQPLHAAAVARDDRVVLLVGRAGVGKSSLTYAAARAGFAVFAEDIVWLQTAPVLRVWGLANRMHLPADAHRRFPELQGRQPTVSAAGELKLVVPVQPSQRPARPFTSGPAVCLLERNGGAKPTLAPVGAAELRRLLEPTEAGFLLFADTIGPALDGLVPSGGWRLELSDDPTAAVPLLERIVGQPTPALP